MSHLKKSAGTGHLVKTTGTHHLVLGCQPCNYYQARRCFDDSLSSVWVESGDVTIPSTIYVPYGRARDCGCLHVGENSPCVQSVDDIPYGDTLLHLADSDFTIVDGCTVGEHCGCDDCDGETADIMKVTFEDVTIHTCSQDGFGNPRRTTGTLDGTYCLVRYHADPCMWVCYSDNVISKTYGTGDGFDCDCDCGCEIFPSSGSAAGKLFPGVVITLHRFSGYWAITVITVENNGIFTALAYSDDCATPVSVANDITCDMSSPPGQVGCDGSVSIEPAVLADNCPCPDSWGNECSRDIGGSLSVGCLDYQFNTSHSVTGTVFDGGEFVLYRNGCTWSSSELAPYTATMSCAHGLYWELRIEQGGLIAIWRAPITNCPPQDQCKWSINNYLVPDGTSEADSVPPVITAVVMTSLCGAIDCDECCDTATVVIAGFSGMEGYTGPDERTLVLTHDGCSWLGEDTDIEASGVFGTTTSISIQCDNGMWVLTYAYTGGVTECSQDCGDDGIAFYFCHLIFSASFLLSQGGDGICDLTIPALHHAPIYDGYSTSQPTGEDFPLICDIPCPERLAFTLVSLDLSDCPP